MQKEIEKYFSIFFITAIAIGLFFPSFGIIFEPFMLYFLLAILFLSILKIDTIETFKQIKKPALLAYIVFVLMIATPIILFLITKHLYPEIAIPVLILTAMPAGMAASALTDISKGSISLALIVTIITTLLCPFTIPFLLKYMAGSDLAVSTDPMLLMLVEIIFTPFAFAIIVRKIAKRQIENTKKYYSSMTIILIMPLIMGPLSRYSEYYRNNLGQIFSITIYMFIISAMLHIIGWLMVFWLKKEDKIAVSITNAYMNLSLAIVFTSQFFGPLVLLPVILYQFPWDTMLIPFRYMIKKQKSN
jgi:bile acid:Na+ symporter, BASS family